MMKGIFAVIAGFFAAFLLFDSGYKFILKNTKKYIRSDSFRLDNA